MGAAVAMLLAGDAFAQQPPRVGAQDPARGQGAGRQQGRGLRQGLPPVGPNMNMAEVQKWLDTWALIEAEKHLQLTEDQYPDFVARLTRLHNVRRRMQMERRRTLAAIAPLVQGEGSGNDETIAARLKALDDIAQRGQEEIRKAYADIDGVLTPAQRGRFRLFEEQIERRKVDLLMKIRPRGAQAPAAGSI
jgi:Spy/CpxP family protein refolding chaperone